MLDEIEAGVLAHAHPIKVTTSHYGTKPLNDYRCTAVHVPARTHMSVDIRNISRLKSLAKTTAVSDGSMHPMTGMTAFAWVLANESTDASVREVEDIWTNPFHMTLYCAEISGIHDMLTYASRHCNLQTPLKVWRDNISVLKMIYPARNLTVMELSNAEGNLVQLTRTLLMKNSLVTLNHVKGHQDDQISVMNLPLKARLNIDCDTCVKRRCAKQYSRVNDNQKSKAMDPPYSSAHMK